MSRFILSVILSVFSLFVVYAQQESIVNDGYQVFKYPNGTISSEGLIRNGKPEGFWKSYYVTGVKKSEGKRTNFLLDSIWVFYDQTGDTTEKISYLYGKRNGYSLKYLKDPGRGVYIYSRELYAGDKREGITTIYYPDGKINQTIPYDGGKKSGLSREYDRDGKIITLLEYNNDFLISREQINRTDNKGLKQGDWKEFHESGGIMREMTYRNDVLHGYYKEYDQKGRLTLTMLYDNGSIVKSNVEDQPDIEIKNRYDANGRLTYSGPYRDTIPVGVHRMYGNGGEVINSFIYNDNGLLLSEGIVNESGYYNGRWKDYYQDGKVRAEGNYSESRRTGIWKFYNSAGRMEQTGSFNNGRPDGLWRWYYENGNPLREEEYFQGRRDGLCTEYSPSGEIISSGQYSDDEKNGEWKFKSGDYIEEGSYIIGLKDGQWKAFYDDGTLRFKGSYVQGNPEGQHLYYYPDGRLKEEQHYRNGLRQKTWKKFDEEGNQVLMITYRDDIEFSINGVKIDLPESDTKLIK